MDVRLRLIIDLLFAIQSPVRLRVGLEGEVGGDAVLVAAQHVGDVGPAAGDGLVLKKSESQRGAHREDRDGGDAAGLPARRSL